MLAKEQEWKMEASRNWALWVGGSMCMLYQCEFHETHFVSFWKLEHTSYFSINHIHWCGAQMHCKVQFLANICKNIKFRYHLLVKARWAGLSGSRTSFFYLYLHSCHMNVDLWSTGDRPVTAARVQACIRRCQTSCRSKWGQIGQFPSSKHIILTLCLWQCGK